MYVQIVLALRWRGRRWFEDERVLRRAVRKVVEVGGGRLLLFCLAGDHVHVVVEGTRQEAGRIAAGLQMGFRGLTGMESRASFVESLTGRAHLERQVAYLLDQPVRHGLGAHPALFTGSCFVDLVGARVLDGFDGGAIRRALPSLTDEGLLRAVRLQAAPKPVDLTEVGPKRLARAACAAMCADPLYQIQPRPVVLARATSAHLARKADISLSRMARPLGCSVRTVQRLGRRAENVEAIRATHRWLALEDAVRASSG